MTMNDVERIISNAIQRAFIDYPNKGDGKIWDQQYKSNEESAHLTKAIMEALKKHGLQIVSSRPGELSWEAKEVFNAIKTLGRNPGTPITLISLGQIVANTTTVQKGVLELEAADFITGTKPGEITLTELGYNTPPF